VNNSNNSGPNGIYVDEFYLSAPTSQAFAMFDLDRVEVLKGPQGTLYGRNTSGGAINFITAKPTNTFEGYLDARYGNFDTSQIASGQRPAERHALGPLCLCPELFGRVQLQHVPQSPSERRR
jgi:outer membrane receptor protein involved in Fe transport